MEAKLDEVLAAYRNGLAADILQAQTNGEWGPIWTTPPCSPLGMERIGRQFTLCRAQKLRHYRRARLRCPSSATATDVVVVSEFPGREQCVTRFDGVILRVDAYLEDDALTSLAASFSPSLRP